RRAEQDTGAAQGDGGAFHTRRKVHPLLTRDRADAFQNASATSADTRRTTEMASAPRIRPAAGPRATGARDRAGSAARPDTPRRPRQTGGPYWGCGPTLGNCST